MYGGRNQPSTTRRSQSATRAPNTATGVLRSTLHGSDQLSYSAANTRNTKSSERSEEHTSELQSRLHLVCRLLLEKKKRPRGYARAVASAARTSELCVPL